MAFVRCFPEQDPATGAVRERFKGNSAVRDVQFHPRQPHVFAASFDKGAIQVPYPWVGQRATDLWGGVYAVTK